MYKSFIYDKVRRAEKFYREDPTKNCSRLKEIRTDLMHALSTVATAGDDCDQLLDYILTYPDYNIGIERFMKINKIEKWEP